MGWHTCPLFPILCNLTAVTVRVCTMPVPGSPQNVVDVAVNRLPAKLAVGLDSSRDEFRRIAGTTWGSLCGNGMSRHLARGLDQLPHRDAGARAQVVDTPVAGIKR